ncbi:gamma carbonic anhydrase family protein, partial [Escherichia coli]|nr:gamma carbonic anhydrase family protein [Escherichia coli]
VPPGKRLESGFLYLCSPVKKIPPLHPAQIKHNIYSANN